VPNPHYTRRGESLRSADGKLGTEVVFWEVELGLHIERVTQKVMRHDVWVPFPRCRVMSAYVAKVVVEVTRQDLTSGKYGVGAPHWPIADVARNPCMIYMASCSGSRICWGHPKSIYTLGVFQESLSGWQ
ncbi:hypothetical protein KI387_008569, partial [Taxus chinensis]